MTGKKKLVTETEFKYLNNRLDKTKGFYKKFESLENTVFNLKVEIRMLKKERTIMMKEIEKLKQKTINLPKKIYKRRKQ